MYKRLDSGLSAGGSFFGEEEEERQETMERNELDSLHTPLPPEPSKCIIQRRRGLLCTDMINRYKYRDSQKTKQKENKDFVLPVKKKERTVF